MHKKIDLFYNGNYIASTTASKTCKEAKAKMLQWYKQAIDHSAAGYTDKFYAKCRDIVNNPDKLTARFDKS